MHLVEPELLDVMELARDANEGPADQAIRQENRCRHHDQREQCQAIDQALGVAVDIAQEILLGDDGHDRPVLETQRGQANEITRPVSRAKWRQRLGHVHLVQLHVVVSDGVTGHHQQGAIGHGNGRESAHGAPVLRLLLVGIGRGNDTGFGIENHDCARIPDVQAGEILRNPLQLDGHGDHANEVVIKNQLAGIGYCRLPTVGKVMAQGPLGRIALRRPMIPGLRPGRKSRMRKYPLEIADVTWLGQIAVHPPEGTPGQVIPPDLYHVDFFAGILGAEEIAIGPAK